jgi:hypothetical protein
VYLVVSGGIRLAVLQKLTDDFRFAIREPPFFDFFDFGRADPDADFFGAIVRIISKTCVG